MKKLRLAIIGQGRSGRGIHGYFYTLPQNKYFEVVAVVDELENRRGWALERYGCKDTYADYRELFNRNDIDVVINASYSYEHYPITKDLLLHGFNVVVEKPMAKTYKEAMELIAIAKEKGVYLNIFQQTMVSSQFLKLKEIIDSGIIGDPIQVNLRYTGYALRYDWQTAQSWGGGDLYNTGPHGIGQALTLLDFDPNYQVAFSKLSHIHSSGDGDDYAKVIFTAPGKPVIDLEVGSCQAFPQDMYTVHGTLGSAKVHALKYEIKYCKKEELNKKELVLEALSNPDGTPAYCSNPVTWYEEKGEVEGRDWEEVLERYYSMLYYELAEGKKMPITAEKGAEVVRVLEKCTTDNPIPVKYPLNRD